MPTQEKIIFLTFDACGGPYGSGYDQKLLDFLNKEEKVEATLLLNSRWLEANPELARQRRPILCFPCRTTVRSTGLCA